MKRIYVNEKWCLGCHLCEYYCAFANSGQDDMVKALKDIEINPRIKVEEKNGISFAVSCRHCSEPLCVKGCISGALTIQNGIIRVDRERCVGCYTCILSCPYGAVMPSEEGVIQKCELCVQNGNGQPVCVQGCPNQAILFEEREQG
jgi:carbon-monoxide dehydrogenase iron sulfur subunit